MSFFGKMIGGAALRRAVEAEAGGDYAEAARAYASAGDRPKVGEMHLLLSERAMTPDGRLEALREAARWADADDPAARRIRARVAAALLMWVKLRGLVTDGDRAVVREAAMLFVSAGDAGGAGQCHELLGSSEAAAEAYQSAGDVERLEQLLDGQADDRRRDVAVRDALEDHRYRLRCGDPHGALQALNAAIDAAPAKDRPDLERTRTEIIARRLPPGRLRLVGERGAILVARPPVVIGRAADASLPLRDGGVSRHHVEIRREPDGWSVADLGSKNGTTLGGVPLAGRVALPAKGELGVGELCSLSFSAGAQLEMRITRGLDQGLLLVAGERTIVAPGVVSVRFADDGRPRISRVEHAVFVGGRTNDGVEPLVGEEVEVGGTKWTVSA